MPAIAAHVLDKLRWIAADLVSRRVDEKNSGTSSRARAFPPAMARKYGRRECEAREIPARPDRDRASAAPARTRAMALRVRPVCKTEYPAHSTLQTMDSSGGRQ